MFTKDDFVNYFSEMEATLRNMLVIYTDVLNEANDQSLKSRLFAITEESMASFETVQKLKEKLQVGSKA